MSPRHVHVIGIGGIGVSSIALVLRARGDIVSGSDKQASALADELAQLGVQIHIGHLAENVDGADLVLVTSAAPRDNPEVIEATRRGIRIVKRADLFPELTAGHKTIAVAGTHGKTTTTGMIATILMDAGLDPTVIVGGIIPELHGNARAGNGPYWVIEADEYDRAFLGLRPHIAVVTSIEMDHPDIYADIDEMAKAFHTFMQLVTPDGWIVACGDAARVVAELEHVHTPAIRYGLNATNEWRADDIRPNAAGGSDYTVWHGSVCLGDYALQIPGAHNVQNALAALAVADRVGVESTRARETLSKFRGAERRFQVKNAEHGPVVVDDYAHHPSEIRATLAAARGRYPGREIWAVFQPHTFSRTRALLADFAAAFADADHVLVADIFAARELDDPEITSERLVERMVHPDARYVAGFDGLVEVLMQNLTRETVLVTLGAGDINRVGERVAELFAKQPGRD